MQTLQPQPHALSLSSTNAISPLSLLPKLSSLSLNPRPRSSTLIRMGGGPRTYPGGVSKWQWKRMQAKKAKQLLKARLNRERQIYEMRKRAELKAAVAELERPWELVQKAAPKSSALFSVSADEQLKVLADRFQKPGGFDLWSDDDGPQLFVTPDDGLPSARFFPKGVVHSVKPYGRIAEDVSSGTEDDDFEEGSRGLYVGNDDVQRGFSRGGSKSSRGRRNGRVGNGSFVGGSEGLRDSCGDDNGERKDGQSDFSRNGLRSSRGRRNGSGFSSIRGRRLGNGSFAGGIEDLNGGYSESSDSRGSNGGGNGDEQRGSRKWDHDHNYKDTNGANLGGRKVNHGVRSDSRRWSSRGRNVGRSRRSDAEDVYDMSLQHDGSYGISSRNNDA